MNKQITMSLELATKLYNGKDSDLKALALENFPQLANIKERVKSFEDVCVEMGKDPKNYETNSSDARSIYLNQIDRLLLIHECFRQGVKMDPNNINQRKWWPWFDLEISPSNPSGFRFYASNYSHTYTNSVLGPLLWLQDEETSDYVGKTFESEFKKAILIS